MATVTLKNITDPELPEPKGVSTATVDQIYLADGAGSGVWTKFPTGWANYQDDGSAQVFNTTAAKLTIDGDGSNTNEVYLPPAIRGTGSLWDTTNDLITPVSIGDSYSLRLDLPVTAKSGSPNTLFLSLDIGGGATPTIEIVDRAVSVPSSVPYTVSVGFPIFCLSTFKTNGGQFFLESDTGTVTITNPSIFLSRTHAGQDF